MILKIVTLFFVTINSWAQSKVEFNEANCLKQNEDRSKWLYENDFRWDYSPSELLSRFFEINKSDKRLAARAYFDPTDNNFKLPYLKDRGGDVVVPETFIRNIRNHIEAGFEKNVVEAVFFPDMGHSHFLIPTAKYRKIYLSFPVSKTSRMYETLFADSEIKVLYHTAEQLKMLDDQRKPLQNEEVQFRIKHRNLVGLNNGSKAVGFLQNPDSPVNTAHDLKDHTYYGAGFNISTNENGCFAYKKGGTQYFFDLSLFDLVPNDATY